CSVKTSEGFRLHKTAIKHSKTQDRLSRHPNRVLTIVYSMSFKPSCYEEYFSVLWLSLRSFQKYFYLQFHQGIVVDSTTVGTVVHNYKTKIISLNFEDFNIFVGFLIIGSFNPFPFAAKSSIFSSEDFFGELFTLEIEDFTACRELISFTDRKPNLYL
uniref:Uncharacterized protein n=1 Tax=Megaselia scalaris TaxID=36166 RepID=T1GHZ9_MEGSC